MLTSSSFAHMTPSRFPHTSIGCVKSHPSSFVLPEDTTQSHKKLSSSLRVPCLQTVTLDHPQSNGSPGEPCHVRPWLKQGRRVVDVGTMQRSGSPFQDTSFFAHSGAMRPFNIEGSAISVAQ